MASRQISTVTMIEIILVIFLCRRIKSIVVAKGYQPGIWQLWVVLGWFGAEILGALISVFLFGASLWVAALSGLLCAIGCAIAIQRKAQSLPDLTGGMDQWLDNMGKDDPTN